MQHNVSDKRKPRYVIGIDPGVNTGFAVWDREEGLFTDIDTVMIHDAILIINCMRSNLQSIEAVIEDARHISGSPERKLGAGSVRRDCKIWEEFLTDSGIPYRFVRPKKGDSMRKLSSDKFRLITGWQKRTTEHSRDAAGLVYGL